MTVVRPARLGSLAAAALVLGCLAPAAASAAPSVAASGAVLPASAAPAAGKSWHLKVTVGKGKRAAKVLTCVTGSPGNYTAWFKMTTRSSTDRRYPRVSLDLVEGSHVSGSDTALMPGQRTQTFSDGPWSSAGRVTIKVHVPGKTKKKILTVGSLGAC